MYTTSKDIIIKAKKGGYAVPAFNCENLEMVQAIIAAAEETKSPVLLQTTPSTVKYLTLRQAYAMVKAEADAASVPVSLHLDHCESYEGVCDALDAGYSSVMIDASKLPFDENIALTAKTVAEAHRRGIPVEAELGTVGGKEDSRSASIAYTDPDQALEFYSKTGIDIFAVAIGTAHGFYVGTPVLDKPRVSAIKEVVDVPLVLHGASGLSEEDVRECVERGMCKVNFATELRVAYTDAVKKLLKEKPETFDPKKLGVVAMEAVKEQVIARMKMCGCDGKAE